MRRRYQRGVRGNVGLVFLASQIIRVGVNNIPPVTLATLALNVAVFMGIVPNMPKLRNACTSNHLVFGERQWKRLLLSSFYHLDDMHLYYNMISFIWKGVKLEPKLKSKKYFIVIALFSVLTQLVMLGLNQCLKVVSNDSAYLHTCAAGFSAVLFALKVLTTYYSDGHENVMGIRVPSRYACWAELVLIQVMVPNSSFTGHLAGILVGLLYVLGPLKRVVKAINNTLSTRTPVQRQRNYNEDEQFALVLQENAAVDEDEALQRAIRESLRESSMQPPPLYGWNVSPAPSAPHLEETPYPQNNENPPYPPDPYLQYEHNTPCPNGPSYPQENTPHPSDNAFLLQDTQSQFQSQNPDLETLRARRLEQFQAKKR